MDAVDLDIAEVSPDGRYIRYNEMLGRGAFKNVYKGFDEIDGIEVAWSQVSIEDAVQSPEHLERLYSEVHLLRTLKHENVIRSYDSWVDDENKTINMITELFTSGNLRQYWNKHKSVDMRAIKNWAKQILHGLDYLHTHNPPIIHRDLKCDNIFVNGNHGEVKIGDLGLATIMQKPTARSVIGTPEFMAPELYDEEYNELADVYSFGMCMLELVSCECPYSECKNQAQIYKKVTSGIKPAALGRIKNQKVRQFIERCLLPASQRPSANELLKSPLLLSEYRNGYTCDPLDFSGIIPKTVNFIKSDTNFMDVDGSCKMLSCSTFADNMSETSVSVFETQRSNERNKFNLRGEKCDGNSISLTLRIADCSGSVRNVHFFFYLNIDTALSIAAEMVDTLDLWKDDVPFIADLIESMVLQIVSHRGTSKRSDEDPTSCDTRKSSADEASGFASCSISRKEGDISPKSHATKGSKLMQSVAASSHNAGSGEFEIGKNRSIGMSMISDGMKTSGTSCACSWITATSGMSLSISSLSLTEKGSEVSDDLKVQLDAIDTYYQQRCLELIKMRESAIENAKKKWMMKKIYVD